TSTQTIIKQDWEGGELYDTEDLYDHYLLIRHPIIWDVKNINVSAVAIAAAKATEEEAFRAASLPPPNDTDSYPRLIDIETATYMEIPQAPHLLGTTTESSTETDEEITVDGKNSTDAKNATDFKGNATRFDNSTYFGGNYPSPMENLTESTLVGLKNETEGESKKEMKPDDKNLPFDDEKLKIPPKEIEKKQGLEKEKNDRKEPHWTEEEKDRHRKPSGEDDGKHNENEKDDRKDEKPQWTADEKDRHRKPLKEVDNFDKFDGDRGKEKENEKKDEGKDKGDEKNPWNRGKGNRHGNDKKDREQRQKMRASRHAL
ncbi:hypothetical protein PFISCL1PPCAC_18825, partial [Pristionchus fissidentatus]